MKKILLSAVLIFLLSISLNAQNIWSGTGFALNNGYLVTNWHVAEDAQTILVYGVRGDFSKKYVADVVAKDEINDLAILKISGNGFPGFGSVPYKVRTSTAEVAEEVWVLGFPMTLIMGDEVKYSDGRINSLTGYFGNASTYQISASVSHGSSGGPVFDNYGNIIGIIRSGLDADVAQNVFYAIKTSFLKNLVETMRVTNILPESSQMGNYAKRQDKYKAARDFVFYIECYDRVMSLDGVANRPSYINVSPTSLSFSEKSESKILTISTNALSWKVASKPDWCTMTNMTATTITINVAKNESYESRRGTIVLETNDGKTVSISVSQLAKKPSYINVSPANISFSEKQESKTLTISTNASSWKVASKPDWCTLTNKTATAIIINVSKNESYESRSGTIVLETNDSKTVFVSVTQAGKERPYITATPTSINIDYKGGLRTISITTNSELWQISSNPDWCTTTNKIEATITINITRNESNESRSGAIVLETNDGKTASVSVSQLCKGNPYITTTPTSIYYSANGGQKGLSISTNSESWQVSSKPDWCTATNKTETSVIINAARNESYKGRNGLILLKTSDGNTISIPVNQSGKNGELNGHKYVDLGLPSGIKWATCNVGATNPEDYGNYYAWGETITNKNHNWSSYRYCKDAHNKLTKYCSNADYGNRGFTDNITTLRANDDAATDNWGNGWRTPTKSEFEELKNKCNWEWTGKGYMVIGPNGNSIFLPAAGSDGTDFKYTFSHGLYWSSSLLSGKPDYAWHVYFCSDGCSVHSNYYRCFGLSVRAVCNPQ